MDPRFIALEANPLYWRGRAKVRNDFADDLRRQSGTDAGSDAVRNEYMLATEYEARAAQIESRP